MVFHLLLYTSIALIIFALLIAFSGRIGTVGYVAGILILFTALYQITLSLARRALRYPEKVRARVSATLYVLGFFWLVLSVSILLLSAVFYNSAAERGMLRLLNMIIFSAIVLLGLSISSIFAARKIWR